MVQEEHDVQFIPPSWNAHIGLADGLHLVFAFMGTDLIDYLSRSPSAFGNWMSMACRQVAKYMFGGVG